MVFSNLEYVQQCHDSTVHDSLQQCYVTQLTITAIKHMTEYNKAYNGYREFNCIMDNYRSLDPISTRAEECHNNKKSLLKYNQYV